MTTGTVWIRLSKKLVAEHRDGMAGVPVVAVRGGGPVAEVGAVVHRLLT